MKRQRICQGWVALIILVLLCGVSGQVEDSSGASSGSHPAPAIPRSLSAEEVRALQEGEGMGLARPAELHGYPGPAHVLDAARQGKIQLYAEQRQAIERIHSTMRAEAQALGREILALESRLEASFRAGGFGETELARQVEEIGRKWAALRLTHLRAHLLTRALLRPEQIEEYYQFRGLPTEPSQHRRGH